MSNITDIQWADTTVNPIMGCGGCELFPSPGKVLEAIDAAVAEAGSHIDARAIYKELIKKAYSKIDKPKPGHKNAVNTTNIWHLRGLFLELLKAEFGNEAEAAADRALRQSITCYAATTVESVPVAVNFVGGTLFWGTDFIFAVNRLAFACRRRLGALDWLWSCSFS